MPRPVEVKLSSSGSLSFVDALGPPMEARGRADHVGLAVQRGAPGELGVLQLLDRGEMAVDQARVGERLQVLGGLQFGGIRRQEEQVHVLGDPQPHARRLPAGAIQDEDDLLGGARAGLTGERCHLHFTERDAHAGGQMKQGPARGGMHTPHQGAPGETPPGSARGNAGAPARRDAALSAPRLGAGAV